MLAMIPMTSPAIRPITVSDSRFTGILLDDNANFDVRSAPEGPTSVLLDE